MRLATILCHRKPTQVKREKVSFTRGRRDCKPWYGKRDNAKNLGDPFISCKQVAGMGS